MEGGGIMMARSIRPAVIVSSLILLVAGVAQAADIPAAVQRAVDDPGRPAAARARDAGRKPAEILTFFGIHPGMRVLEVGAGGGYYTEILSNLLGDNGEVIAQNSQFIYDRVEKTVAPLYAARKNIRPYVGSLVDLDLPDNSLDAALIILIFHHMHFDADHPNQLPERTKAVLQNIRRWLKPGGVLGVIEHAALPGTSRAASAPLHRVDEQTTIADITGQGFVLAATSDILQVASDDRSVYWRNTPHRGKTWRFVHKYVKPATQ